MSRKSNESLIDMAVQGRWTIAASIAGGVWFFGYIVFPALTANNVFLRPMVAGLKPVFLLIASIFAIIALLKWLLAQREAGQLPVSNSRKSSAAESWGDRKEPLVTSGASDAVRSESPSVWSLELIQALEWKRFEDVCQKFYELKGIRSACTALGPDGGVDIRLYQEGPDKATAIVQCKAWGDSFVGVKPVRELLGVMVHEKMAKAFFMTSGSYSDEAKNFAAPNRITLIDGKMFLAMIERLPEAARRELLTFATDGDYNVPTCPRCGVRMRLIAGKGGKADFWGCGDYPRCRQRLGARRGARLVTAYYE